jgi:hypothetical protein
MKLLCSSCDNVVAVGAELSAQVSLTGTGIAYIITKTHSRRRPTVSATSSGLSCLRRSGHTVHIGKCIHGRGPEVKKTQAQVGLDAFETAVACFDDDETVCAMHSCHTRLANEVNHVVVVQYSLGLRSVGYSAAKQT